MAATRTSQARTARRNAGRPSREEMYIHGNTVRKLAPVEEPVKRVEREPERRERQHVNYTVRRNQEKALQLDLRFLCRLSLNTLKSRKID